MPSLEQSLHGYDIGHLRILAERWGVELAATETDAARKELAESLLDKSLVREMYDALPEEARAALDALLRGKGRLPWAFFTRRFGEVREMGAGRRDREAPHLNPVSAAETLFYRAFLARAFFDTPDGPQEFAYIPDDILPLLPPPQPLTNTIPGRPARPEEYEYPLPANGRILDDATTFLAARRAGRDLPPDSISVSTKFLESLLRAAELISETGEVLRENVKDFLTKPRREALETLVEVWDKSETINELRQMPHLRCEGAWSNDPLAARRFIRESLAALPKGKWQNLNALINDIHDNNPDFQRTAGEYDSWFIRRAEDDTLLRGFEHWEEVEGALLRHLITGPMYWLGLVDLASAEEDGESTAFRVREALPEEEEMPKRARVSSQAEITIPRLAPRAFRYQIARFCEWLPRREADAYRYRLTPAALARGREENLEPHHFLALLKKHAAGEIPPSLSNALTRWALNGTEARAESHTLLRLRSPEILEMLRRSKAGRFLGEEISPTDVVIRKHAIPQILAALAEMGILGEDKTEEK